MEKKTYKEELRARVAARFGGDRCDGCGATMADEIFEFVEAEALASWKNGLAAGKARRSKAEEGSQRA